MDRRSSLFLGCLVGLLLAMTWFFFWPDRTPHHGRLKAQYGFQHKVGGLGMGSVIVPRWNFRDYDPRLQPVANDELYPLPGGYAYSPDRLSMVSSFAGLAP